MQGCTAPPVSPARQDKHNITSFPEASKISSSLGQNLATPQAMGREPGQETVTPQSAGNGCRSSGATVLHRHFNGVGEQLNLHSSGHRHQVLPAQGSSPLCLFPPSTPMAAPVQDLLFPDLCFSLLLDEARKHSKHSTLQASPWAQLQLEWPLLAPHKYCSSHTPGAVGQLCNRSCIPLVRFQLPFSATSFLK